MKRSSSFIQRAVLEALEHRRLLSFATPVHYAAPLASKLETGDFNGDGRLDLATTSTDGVFISLGGAGGAFGAAQQVVAGRRLIAVGDLNGDSKPDLITVGTGDVFGEVPSPLHVLIGNGDATFQAPISTTLPARVPPGYTGATPRPQLPASVAVGDINGDGKLDLLAMAQTAFSVDLGSGPYGTYTEEHYHTHVNVLLGHGHGTFAAATTTTLPQEGNGNYLGVMLKDFDSDTKLDLMIGANFLIEVYPGNDNGTFGAPLRSPMSPQMHLSGDFDNDGNLDFIGFDNSGVGIPPFLKGRGDGTFEAGSNLTMPHSPVDFTVADVNGDGNLDLASLHGLLQQDGFTFEGAPVNPRTTDRSVVILGYGDGAFAPAVTNTFGTTPGYSSFTAVVAGDFDGDTRTDMAGAYRPAGTGGTSIAFARNLNDWAPPPPGLHVSDLSVVEGDGGPTTAVFTVTLVKGPSNQNVTVNYATAPLQGNFDAIPGEDFTPASGTLTFLPGQKTRTVSVAIAGDVMDEFDQPFYLQLSGAAGGGVQLVDGWARATVIDNDATPTLTIENDVAKKEGNSGVTPFVFTISLSGPSEKAPQVSFINTSGTAYKEGQWVDGVPQGYDFEYYPNQGGVAFYDKTKTSLTYTVGVYGDTAKETSEMFFVDLWDPEHVANVIIADGHAVGIILDDDNTASSVKTWVGPAGGGDWSNGANWSPSGVPGALHDVVINGDVAVNLAANISVRGIALAGGASLAVDAAGNHVVRTAGLAIDTRSKLNLNDNDLVFDFTQTGIDTPPPPTVDTVNRLLVNGSIYTGQAAASGRLTNLGVANASDVLDITGSQTATFSGQVVDSTSVLVKFTYAGDATLDGIINVDDYGRIDSNIGTPGAFGWFNGDFNYDGKVNIDDYGIIDSNIAAQGEPFLSAGSATMASPPSSSGDEAQHRVLAAPSVWSSFPVINDDEERLWAMEGSVDDLWG